MIQKLKHGIGNLSTRLIKWLARRTKINLIKVAYTENGLLKSHSLAASGEYYFTQRYLPSVIKKTAPVLIDIGANVGDYSKLLRRAFPEAFLYCFEPNPNTFTALKEKADLKNLLFNVGVGSKTEQLNLYFDEGNKTSVQATSDPKILDVIAHQNDLSSVEIPVTTLDLFCKKHRIDFIDFLKIDTEGFELEVLQGAERLLNEKKIKIIQFEFNEVNIVKRRFLRDFYLLLPNYDFFRLDEKRLIPLGEWKPEHEIFQFQNIAAIRK